MSEHRPAWEALKGTDIAILPGQILPPQQSPDSYTQRPLPPIPLRSPARASIRTSASSHQHGRPPPAPPRSPARASASRPLAPPPEYWKPPHSGLASSNRSLPPSVVTGSRASGGQYQLDLPLPDPPFIRKKSWSVGGTKADSDVLSQSVTVKNPTLHNSADKIRRMIGHDVNINFDTGYSRAQSDTYDSATYTAPASSASSSCYSNETVETTVSEPAPPAPANEGQHVTEYDDDLESTLVAEGFNFHPSPKALPDSPLSAHIDPLILKRRAEVLSGKIRLGPAIHSPPQSPEPGPSHQSTDSRRTSASGAGSKEAEKEDYVVKDLYHATTAHIAASVKRHERREYPPSLPSKPAPWVPASQAMSRLSFSPRLLTSQKRNCQLGSLPFSASAFEVGDRPLRTPYPASPPAGTSEPDDERNHMPKASRWSNSAEEKSPSLPEIQERSGLQDLVAQARKGAGLLTRSERRRTSLRHKIRVIPEGDRV